MVFEGQVRPIPYALGSASTFFSQHLAVAALFAALHQHLNIGWRFYLFPLRSVGDLQNVPAVTYALAFALMLVAAWVLAVLAFRRAANANLSGWVAAAAIVPIIQVPVIVALCVPPTRPAPQSTPSDRPEASRPMDWSTAIQGMLAGMGLTVFTVAVGALIFGMYGYGMFVLGPFLIGATTAYLANRKGDIGAANSVGVVVCATALGGIALVAVALEGVICIVLASPLAVVAALIGGMLGRAAAMSAKRSARQSLTSVALLPMVFLLERALPPSTNIDTSQSIDVAAPADVVWRSLIHMDAINSVPALPFRLGVAYPVGAEIIGEGVGATRRGVFSTGVALECVTEWKPDRKLAFVVLSDPPAMRELSPYKHVHAPHVVGYFHTTYTSFELLPLAEGRTRVVLRTDHELKLDPVLYWLPLARWVVTKDNARVLDYVRRQSERSARVSLVSAPIPLAPYPPARPPSS
jgi:MFS family permease